MELDIKRVSKSPVHIGCQSEFDEELSQPAGVLCKTKYGKAKSRPPRYLCCSRDSALASASGVTLSPLRSRAIS